jgi:MoaA/NifB/PqqE/SkfB family radical SAM enzyme
MSTSKNYLNITELWLCMQIIRKTQSVCPKCIKKINAQIVEENKKVYMHKKCQKHGKFKVLLSNKPSYYKKLTKLYFSLNKDKMQKYKRNYFNLYVTLKCNFNCSFCLTKANQGNSKDISLEKINKLMKNWKNTKIGLWGGEPTVREDLPEIIKIIKKSGNIPALYTNGTKIANYNYLNKLKNSGLEIVHLQFDGFDDGAYKIIRKQKNLTKTKLEALDNLNKLNMPVVLETTFIKGVNENEIINVLNYAVKNNFIKAVLFRSYSPIGRKSFKKENEILGEELVEILENKTHGRISNEKILEFQKLLFIFYDLVSIKRCFYNQYLLINRNNTGYETINDIINLTNLDTESYYKSDKNIYSKINFIARALPQLVNSKTFKILTLSLSTYLSRKLIKRSFTSSTLPKELLILGFGCICNAYNYDVNAARCCIGGEITAEGKIISSLVESNLGREKDGYN